MPTIGQLLVTVGVNASGVASGLREAEKNIESFGTRMFFLGSRITAGVTVPLTAAMGVVAKFGLEFDKAMSESTAIMGDMSDTVRKEMEDVALSISKSSKFGAKEAAEAYYDLASAGFTAQEAMGSLGTVATFAQAGVIDLSKSGEYLATALASVGLESLGVTNKTEGMAKVADVLVKANNLAVGTTEDYVKALNNTRGALRIYGVSLEQGTAALMAFAQGGTLGQKAGQQLYMVLRDMQRVAQRHAEDWKKLGLSVYDATGAMRPLGDIIVDIQKKMEGMTTQQKFLLMDMLGFPDRSRAATQALLGFGGAIQNWTKELQNAGGTAKAVADNQMKALANQLLQLQHQMEAALIEVFKALVPVIQQYVIPAIEAMIGAVQSLADWLNSLSIESRAAVVGVLAFMAALGPTIALVGSWTLAMSGVMRIFSGLTGLLGFGATTIGTVASASGGAAAATTLLARAASALLGPWGIAIGLGVALVGVLYSMATARSDVQAAAEDNTKSFNAETTSAEKLIARFEMLRAKQQEYGLTTKEADELRKITDQLAISTGRSSEAFLAETRASDDLIKSLKEQNAEKRKALDSERQNQRSELARLEELSEKMQRDVQRLQNEPTRYTTQGLMMGVRPETPAERKSRVDAYIADLAKVSDALQRQQSLIRAGGLFGDNPFGDNAFTGTGKPGSVEPPAAGGGGSFVKPEKIELLEKFKKKLDQVTEALQINFNAGNIGGGKLLEMYKEYNDEVTELGRQSDIWGTKTEAVFNWYRMVFGETKKAEDLAKVMKTIAEGDTANFANGIPANMVEEFKKMGEEQEKLSQMTAEFGQKYNAQFMTESQARIGQIEVERKKAIEAAEAKYAQNVAEAEKARAAINKYYDLEVDKANETQNTIVQRMKDAGVQTAKAHQESTDKMLRNFKQMQVSGEFTANTLFQAWKKWFDEMQKSNPFKQMGEELSGLGSAFSNLSQVAGEGFGGFAKDVGEIVASMGLANKAADIMVENLGRMKVGFKSLKDGAMGAGSEIASSFIGLATGIVSGISGLMQATGGANLGKNMLGGAMSGAMLGGSVAMGGAMALGMTKGMMVAGVWGAVAGAIIGIIVAVFRGRETRSIMKRVGNEWGVEISQGLADSIKSGMKDGNLSRVASTLMNMDKIIEEAGGLNNLNFDKFIGKLHDVFSALEGGELSMAQATNILETNFSEFANIVVKSGKVASKEFLDILRLVRETGMEVAAVTEFIAQQTERFGGAMATIAQSAGEKYVGLAAGITEAKDALKELDKQRLDAMGGKKEEDLGVEDREKIADIDKKRAETEAKLAELMAKQKDGAAAMAGEMERIGMITLAGFNAAMNQGVGVVQALGSVSPAIQALKQAYKDLGLEVDNAALKQLFLIDQLATEQPALVNGVGALGEAMLALSNIGGLNAETFASMQVQGMAMYERLQAEAQKLGIDQSFAIQAMVPFLKGVISAAEEYGFTIDENTMKLIEQAREMGLLTDKELSTNDILMQGLSAIITALGGTIPEAWKKMAKTAKDELGGINDRAKDIFNDFPIPPVITVPIEWDYDTPPWNDVPGRPPGRGPAEPPNGSPDVPELAEGGIVRKRTLAYIGERGPEAVIPLPGTDFGEREAVIANVFLDGRKVSLSNVRQMPGVLRARGITTR